MDYPFDFFFDQCALLAKPVEVVIRGDAGFFNAHHFIVLFGVALPQLKEFVFLLRKRIEVVLLNA